MDEQNSNNSHRQQYTPGAVTLPGVVKTLKQAGSQSIDKLTENETPEQKAQSLQVAEGELQTAKNVMSQAPADQRAALAEEHARLLEERAAVQGRGLSTGEKIAQAILSSAPMIASAFTPGSNYNQAMQGSQQIAQNMETVREKDTERQVAGLNSKIQGNREQAKESGRLFERDEDYKRDLTKDERDFEQQKELLRLKSGLDRKDNDIKDKAAVEKYAQNKAKMFINDPLYKKSVSELASYDKGFTALMSNNANGYSDIAGMFNFIKGLDESVVRPSEIELFNEARSLADRFSGFVKNKQTGEQFLQENRAKLAQVQGLLAKLPARYLNNMNLKAQEGEDEGTAKRINIYLKQPKDILSIKTSALLNKELEKERLEGEAASGVKAPALDLKNMTLEQKRAEARKKMGQ